MTDEEKKAIFYLKDLENDKEHLIIEQRQSINIILNLIEKQQKEIEELKEESKEYQIGFAQGCYERDLDWQDKIKAKIKEQLQIGWKTKEERWQQNYALDILQSLLPRKGE